MAGTSTTGPTTQLSRPAPWRLHPASMVYEKEHLLIDGSGKYPDYNFYHKAGIKVKGKDKGQADNEKPPVDVRSLMP